MRSKTERDSAAGGTQPRRSVCGFVTRLVERDRPRTSTGRQGVISMGELSKTCVIEYTPAVGDLILGDIPGIVERVKITREGRVLIYARPVETSEPSAKDSTS
jgi:hypothetical protein